MAIVYQSQGDYTLALEYYERALIISERSLGLDHSDTGDILRNMANVFKLQGEFARALEYYDRVLAIDEKSFGPDHPSTAGTVNNVAGVFLAQGELTRALACSKRALTIIETSLGPHHPSTGTISFLQKNLNREGLIRPYLPSLSLDPPLTYIVWDRQVDFGPYDSSRYTAII